MEVNIDNFREYVSPEVYNEFIRALDAAAIKEPTPASSPAWFLSINLFWGLLHKGISIGMKYIGDYMMNKFIQGEDVQSLVDRGAPLLVVMDYREIPESVGIPHRYMYLCDNNKWYNEFELGKV